MKRKIILLCVFLLTFFLSGCGTQENAELEEKVYLSDEELELAYESPDEYRGKYISFIGRVYTSPVYGDGVYFEVFAEPDKFTKNTLVYYTGEENIKIGNYYKINAKIIGAEEFTNQKNEKAIGLAVQTDNIEESSYIECCSPTLEEIVIGETVDQYGYAITIDKIEFAEEETRVYVTATNNGEEKLNVSKYRVFWVQNQMQYEQQHNTIAMYEWLEEPIRPGVKSSGIIAFPKLDAETGFTIYFQAYALDAQLREYVFEY